MTDLTHLRFEGRRRSRTVLPPSPGAAPGVRGVSEGALRAVPDPPVSGLPAFVLSRAGLEPGQYRQAPLRRRVTACLRALRVQSEPAACEILTRRPELLQVALSTLLIGVSGFFRDTRVFDALRTVVIPALRSRPGTIRVWSVGASQGAELYSVGMLLAEADLLHRVRLLGTDCRSDAVAAARAAVFPPEALVSVAPTLRPRYFEVIAEGYRVADALRQVTEWQTRDAMCHAAEGPWDLVLCRNMVIYLDPAAGQELFRRLAGVLAPGGFLVVGKAERPQASIGLTALDRCIYVRQ